jgi:hypothetical protein
LPSSLHPERTSFTALSVAGAEEAMASFRSVANGEMNRFPDFVRYVVHRLKTLCPIMGKVKIARAGLHVRTTLVGRTL